MPSHRFRFRSVVALLVGVLLLATACGGGGDDGDDSADDLGDPTSFTIWVPAHLQDVVEPIVEDFRNREPGITVEVVYDSGVNLEDRLLLGERPDLYLTTEINQANFADQGTLPEDFVVFGADTLQLVVAPGNPKRITDVSVFQFDPTTTSGLCERESSCGRAARILLENAGVVAEPDVIDTPENLVQGVGGRTIDATLLYRTQTVAARQSGTVEYVALPSTQRIQVVYQFAVVARGDAANRFLATFESPPPSVQTILSQAGYAPLQGDPQ